MHERNVDIGFGRHFPTTVTECNMSTGLTSISSEVVTTHCPGYAKKVHGCLACSLGQETGEWEHVYVDSSQCTIYAEISFVCAKRTFRN